MRIGKLIIFILCVSYGLSFSQTFNFKNFDINEGLSQSYVYTLIQDKQGYLWIGTGEGFSRFDGKTFQNFTISEGLSENFITTALTTANGHIWIGHYNGGISLFNGNTFLSLNCEDKISSSIISFVDLGKGTVLVATQADGMFVIDKYKNIHPVTLKGNYLVNQIHKVSSNFFLATNEGLIKCSYADNELKIEAIYLPSVQINDLYPANGEGNFWIATSMSGIYLFSSASEKPLKKIPHIEDEEDAVINKIMEDKDLNLWFSIMGKGVYKYHVKDRKYELQNHFSSSSGLSNDYIKTLFEDREGNIWFGTIGNGLDQLIDPVFTLYTKSDGLINNNITAVYKSSDQTIWLASEYALLRINKINQKIELVHKLYKDNKNNNRLINTICEDSEGNLLLGTTEDGVWKYNIQNKQSTRFLYSPYKQLNNKIKHIQRDANKNIWIATEDGVFLYANSGEIRHLTMEDGLAHNHVYSIFVDKDNAVWFATHGTGLSCYNNGTIINHRSPMEAKGVEINCFSQDQKGRLWIGTYGQGIFLFDGNEFLKNYTTRDGLVSNYCYSIHADDNDNVWIGHKSGISKFISEKEKIEKFIKKEGFLIDAVNSNAVIEDYSNVLFGTVNGLLKYNFYADKPLMVGPAVNLSDVRLFFRKVDWGLFSDSLWGLSSLPYKVALPYNQNHLTFNVTGISLSASDKIKYQFKLDGFDKEWSLVSNEDFITYSNLPPGTYTFKARAINNIGIWSEEPLSYKFTINSPFWKTWWFMLLSLSSGIGFIMMIIKARTESLRSQREILQEEKTKLLAEIRVRKRAERKQKISEEKLKQTNKELNTFIYKSSHDLRGPLLTVKGLTQLGIMEVAEPVSLKYLNLISDRVNRLDVILRNLIQIVEMTEVDIESSKINFESLLAKVLKSLQNSHLHKKINIETNIEMENDYHNDNKLIFTILRNIIDNSIQFSYPEQRDSFIKIKISQYRNGVLISIKDNGIGIESSVKDKVFEMFFRGNNLAKGSGLGLYVVQKIVSRLEGFIKLDSVYNEGTSIDVYLPSYQPSEATNQDENT
ncbi:MAG: two-component regulator propeller domain-containing protein [Cytophagaceae bacterium]